MLVSIAIHPNCFGADAVRNMEDRIAAERVIAALRGNAVLLCDLEETWRSQVATEVIDLGTSNTKLGQSIQIKIADLLKGQRLTAISLGRNSQGSPSDRLRRIATSLHADIVICRKQ